MLNITLNRRIVADGWRRVSGSLVDLLYPPECCWCSHEIDNSTRLCDPCRKLFISDYYRCQKCATPLPTVLPNADCVRCRDAKWQFSRVVTLSPYRGEIRKAIILMKKPPFEILRRALADLLADRLAVEQILPSSSSTAASVGPAPVLVPVPYHWTHNFSAATDTSVRLARFIGSATGVPVANRIIRRTRKTAKQGMLSWSERKANVRHAFEIRSAESLNGRHVLLVDDVLTSGTTAAEISRLLMKAGAARVDVVVAARATGVRESPAAAP